MKKENILVKVDKRPYREVAQENWGLSKQQMEGMHVHHRIPISEGGSNDPSNLYVCSPSFHAWVWHDGSYFTENSKKGNEAAIKVKQVLRTTNPEWRNRELEICSNGGKAVAELLKTDPDFALRHREGSSRGGVTSSANFHQRCQTDPDFKENWLESCRKGALTLHENRKIDTELNEKVIENCRKNGRKAASRLNSQRWQCTETGFVSTAAGLSNYQRSRNINTSNRVSLETDQAKS